MRCFKGMFLMLVLSFFFFTGCKWGSQFVPTISQGVWGRVEFWEGNFQPGEPGGKITYVKRTILFFEKTTLNSVVQDSCDPRFFLVVNSQLVGSTESNRDGYFQIHLPEGEYSVFVWEKDRYYANLTDGNYIFPVRGEKDKLTEILIVIDYLAYY